MVAARDTYAEVSCPLSIKPTLAALISFCRPPTLRMAGIFGFGGIYSVLWNLLGYPAGVVPFGTIGPSEDVTPRALRK